MNMTIKVQAMGPYQTNCYIVTKDGKDIIIDPGVDATSWVKANVKNPIAILNTHGHFDHVWSNAELQRDLGVKLYTPQEDAMLLKESSWMPDLPPSIPDVLVENDAEFDLDGIKENFVTFQDTLRATLLLRSMMQCLAVTLYLKRALEELIFLIQTPKI